MHELAMPLTAVPLLLATTISDCYFKPAALFVINSLCYLFPLYLATVGEMKRGLLLLVEVEPARVEEPESLFPKLETGSEPPLLRLCRV